MVYGLQKTPELNGVLGVLEHWDEKAARWSIRLMNGDGKRIKAENLLCSPQTIATQAVTPVRASLTKYDDNGEQLRASLVQLEEGMKTALEQKLALEAMEDIPHELLKTVLTMIRKIEANVASTQNKMMRSKAERNAAWAEGMRRVFQLLSDFLQLCE